MRRTTLRLLLSAVLALQLGTGSGLSLPGGVPVIGQVVLCSHATVGDVSLPGEGTLLDDDWVRTDKGGRVVVDFPDRVRAAVGEETRVRFKMTAGKLEALLDSGTVTALKQQQLPLRIDTSAYTIEPAQNGKAAYRVAFLPNRSTTVEAGIGNVLITEKSSGYRYELREGLYATIPAAPAGVPGSPPQEKEGSKPAPEQPAQPAPAPTPTAPPAKPPMEVKGMSAGAKAALIAGIAGGAIAGAAAAAGGGGGGGGGGTVSPTR